MLAVSALVLMADGESEDRVDVVLTAFTVMNLGLWLITETPCVAALKQAAEERASLAAAGADAAAQSASTKSQLTAAVTELEAKLTALKNEARRGASALEEGRGADSAELAEIEAMLRAATNDVARIEEQMGVPGGAQLQGHELDALREGLLPAHLSS